MPVETLDQLARLSQAGAPVIFERSLPADAPGMEKLARRREKFEIAKSKLQGMARITPDVTNALADLGITREPMADSELNFIRRKIDDQYWYFIANHSANTVDQWIPLGVTVKSALLHDPMTGKTTGLASREENGQSQIYLQLAPGESIILQTSDRALNTAKGHYLQPDGQAVALQGPWKVEFIEGGPELPKAYTADKLSSWTECSDPAAEAFAGTARYSIDFDLLKNDAQDWVLDLGDVRESARIYVNAQDAGALFALPFKIDIGHLLKPGKNTLQIEVTNLSANRIRALDKSGRNWKIMKDANIVKINYTAFETASWPLQPSGLLGPVKLVPMQKKILKILE
jgi:hypothetical protein